MPTPESFGARLAGRWTSHPRSQRRLRRLAAAAGVGLFGLLGLALTFGLLNYPRRLPAAVLAEVRDPSPGTLAGVVAGCLLVGLCLTTALVAKRGQLQALGRAAAPASDRAAGFDVVALAVVVGVLVPAVAVLPWAADVSPTARLAGQALLLVPLLVVLLSLQFSATRANGTLLRPRPILRVLATLLIPLTLAWQLIELVDFLGDNTIGRWLADHTGFYRPLLGTVLLVPLAVGIYLLARLAVTTATPEDDGDDGDDGDDEPGPVVRLLRWVAGLLGLLPREAGGGADDDWPAEAEAVVRQWAEEIADDKVVVHVRSRRGLCPPAERPELAMFFGGRDPSADQAAAVDKFSAAASVPNFAEPTGDDLLVCGVAASGRTTTLAAIAAVSTVTRGGRVLAVLGDDRAAEVFAEAAGRQLVAGPLGPLVTAGVLRPDDLDDWAAGATPMPHVVAATVADLERHVYGELSQRGAADTGDVHAAGRPERLRRLLLAWQTVLVDDLDRFAGAAALHLPFLLDKHRLLLRADCRTTRLVVATPDHDAAGQQAVHRRLLGTSADYAATVVPLRRPAWPGVRRLRVTVPAALADDLAGRLATFCRSRGLRFADARGKPAAADVLLADDDARLGALVAGRGLSVSVGPPPARARPPVPLLASATARPLRAAHLRNVLGVLRRGVPVPTWAWARLGALPTALPASDLLPPAPAATHDYLPDDPATLAYVAATDDAPASVALDPYRPGDDHAALVRGGDHDDLHLIDADAPPEDATRYAARYARWHTDDRGPLPQAADLARTLDLRLGHLVAEAVTAGTVHARADAGGRPAATGAVLELAPRRPVDWMPARIAGVVGGLRWASATTPWQVEARWLGRLRDDGRVEPEAAAVPFAYDAAVLLACVGEPAEMAFDARPDAAASRALTAALAGRFAGFAEFARCLVYPGGVAVVEPTSTAPAALDATAAVLADEKLRPAVFDRAAALLDDCDLPWLPEADPGPPADWARRVLAGLSEAD